MDLSFQMYGAREFGTRDPGAWSAVLGRIAALGYTAVEGYAALYEDPPALARELSAHALTMPSAHFSLDSLENEPDATFAVAREPGVRTLYAPSLPRQDRPADVEGWQSVAKRLARLGERVAMD